MKLYDSGSERIKWKSTEDTYKKLITSITNVYEDVVLGDVNIDKAKHHDKYNLLPVQQPLQCRIWPLLCFYNTWAGPSCCLSWMAMIL